jgi:hypothetical protein
MDMVRISYLSNEADMDITLSTSRYPITSLGWPTGAYRLPCLSLASPGLFIKKARLRLLKKTI